MKNYISLFLVSLLFTACYQQERNCKDFKTGKFRAEYEIDGKKQVSVFERTGNLEIETFDGKTDSTSIRWLSDCEYIGQKINPKNMQEKKAVDIKILTTNRNSYTFEFSLVGDSKKQKGIVTKID